MYSNEDGGANSKTGPENNRLKEGREELWATATELYNSSKGFFTSLEKKKILGVNTTHMIYDRYF